MTQTGQIQGTCTFECDTVPHVKLGRIAQTRRSYPIFEKWEPVLAEKLKAANAALITANTPELRRVLLAKLDAKRKRKDKEDPVTDADERRWRLPPDLPKRKTTRRSKRALQVVRVGGSVRHRPRLAEGAAGRHYRLPEGMALEDGRGPMRASTLAPTKRNWSTNQSSTRAFFAFADRSRRGRDPKRRERRPGARGIAHRRAPEDLGTFDGESSDANYEKAKSELRTPRPTWTESSGCCSKTA